MKPIVIGILTVTLATTMLAFGAQKAEDAERLLKAAMNTELVDGNLKDAIEEYKKIVARAGANRTLAATALVRMAECYQKLGDSESRKIYERVVREFADQKESAATARARLAALQAPAAVRAGQAARLIWADVDQAQGNVGQSPSADGRYLSFSTDDWGDLAVRDLREGTTRRLTNNGRWIDAEVVSSVVSPDGRQVAYAWWDIKNEKQPNCCGYDLRVLPVSRGEAGTPQIVYQNDENRWIEVVGWTPDGKSLLVVRQLQDFTHQIAFISIAEGSVRVLKSLEWRLPRKVSLSPDGRSIAYDGPAGADVPARDIFLITADGSRETVVVQNPADDQQPVWSPDGAQVLFVSNRTGNNALWTVHIDAGRPKGSAELVKPDISRLVGMTRSGALYYLSGGPTSNIYTVDTDANVKVKTVPSLATDRFINANGNPVWSPDGQSLAYYSVRTTFSDSARSTVLVIRSLKTGEEREVPSGLLLPVVGNATSLQRGMRVFYFLPAARWFPDSRSVLVVLRDPQRDRTGFYRVDTANGSAELLLYVPYNALGRGFDLSPDGKAIFYTDRGQLMRFDMDSRRETAVKDAPGGNFHSLVVSPDGAQLAYLLSGRLAVMPAGGWGEPREVFRDNTVTVAGHVLQIGTGGARFGTLAWTPDQRYLLFVTDSNVGSGNDENVSELWRVPVTGGEPEHTGVSVRGLIKVPGVSPDGHRMTFGAIEERAHELWALENFLPKAGAARGSSEPGVGPRER